MRRATVFPALILVVLGGCAARTPAPKAEPAPCPLPDPTVAIMASDRVNSSATGQGRPVQVRLYQLKTDARLTTAKFEEIWQDAAATLEADLVKVEELTVYPGETKLVKVARDASAHNLAAVALFREPQGKSWFISYELESPKKETSCSPKERRIALWLDRMQMEDGQGHEGAAPGTAESPRDPGSSEGAAGTKGH